MVVVAVVVDVTVSVTVDAVDVPAVVAVVMLVNGGFVIFWVPDVKDFNESRSNCSKIFSKNIRFHELLF